MDKDGELRAKAETELKARKGSVESYDDKGLNEVIHDLQVHQILTISITFMLGE